MIGILTINNLRPQILHLWCASIKRLRNDIGIDFPAVCVSGVEDSARCSQYGIAHIVASNDLGWEKWNIGTQYLKEQGIDWMVISGSDDVFSTDALKNIIYNTTKDVDLIGFQKIFVYCVEGQRKGELRILTSKNVMGVGKTLNKRVLEAVGWRPWQYAEIRRWGMDAICSRNTNHHCKTRSIIDGIIVDCKTDQSLNKFSMFVINKHGYPADRNIFLNILGEEEKQILGSMVGSNLNSYFTKIKK